jgi:hypothetical protein
VKADLLAKKEGLKAAAKEKLDTAKTTGNKVQAKLNRGVETARAKLADAGKAAKELPSKAAATARKLTDKVKKGTTTRFQGAKDSLKGTFKTAEGGVGRTGGVTGRPSATGPTSKAANTALDKAEKLAAKRVGLLKTGLRLAGGVATVGALGHEAATKSNEELRGQSGIGAVEPLIGTDPTAGGTVLEGTTAPVNSSRFFDPALEALRAPIGLVRGAFGFGDEEGAAKEVALRGGGQPAPAAPRGLTAGGAPAPIFEEDLTQTVNAGTADVADPRQVGVRKFNNADATAAAAGIDPASRRGGASVEENQAVLDRLVARNQGLRAQQFAGSQAAPGVGRQAEGTPAATRAANQAAGGGLASAFGALALSGNQLRRQAAERGREFAASETAADAKNTIQNTLAAQSSKFQALDQASRNRVTDDILSFTTQLNKLRDDPANAERFLDSTFSQAINDPGATGAQLFAQQEAAKEIRELSGRGFFASLKFSTERGLIDWFMSLGQGGQSEPLLLADERSFMTINPVTGMLEIVSPDGSTRQVLDNPQDMTPRVQELLKSIAPQASGRSVGPPQGHPQNLRDLQLRQ